MAWVCVGARASTLDWPSTVREVHALAGGPGPVIEFPFVNGGDKPVHLVRATVSCSCVAVELPASPIAPGQRSRVILRVQSVRNVGQRHLGAALYLDGEPQPVMLSAIVDVDQGVRFEPASLYWPVDGSPAATQVAELVAAEGKKIDSVEAAPNAAYSVRMIRSTDDSSVRLEIRPAAARPPAASSVKVKVQLRGGSRVEAELWLIVKS